MITDFNNDELRQWFIDTTDTFIRGRGEEATAVGQARDYAASKYAKAVKRGAVTPPEQTREAEGRVLFDRFYGAERERRKVSLKKSLDYIIDALNDDTILGTTDPVFDLAFAIGDGTDKALRYWSLDDPAEAANTRNRNAVYVAGRARDFDMSARALRDVMAARGARLIGDLAEKGQAA